MPPNNNYTTDVTGRKWPFFVASGTYIRDLGFLQSPRICWPSIYMSVVEFDVSNVAMIGSYYWGFDPAARGRIVDTHWQFSNRALEAAYGTHDIVLTNSSATRMEGGN